MKIEETIFNQCSIKFLMKLENCIKELFCPLIINLIIKGTRHFSFAFCSE